MRNFLLEARAGGWLILVAIALVAIQTIILVATWGWVAVSSFLVLIFTTATLWWTAYLRTLRNHHQVREGLKSLQSAAAVQVETVTRIDNRARRLQGTIWDTAGSVGRMAPIVRETSRKVATLSAPQAVQVGQPGAKQLNAPPVNYKFPSVSQPSPNPNRPDIHAAVIADEFTATAFSYEWDCSYPTPESWKSDFESRPPDFLFAESAWEGNSGTWRYHLTGASAPRPALKEMLEHLRSQGVPTVFWNKEDPPHFEDFLETARLFDVVFTTEEALIPRYRDELGHDRVFLLPFAAQPRIHNPARVDKRGRKRDIAFGGMYFRHKYPERRQQMDRLLGAAARIGLDIYSRGDQTQDNYKFPEHLQSSIRGSLTYPEMLGAYHAYKVIINVNSVVESQSMCARRIFEATACGAAVVSEHTPAIDRFFPGGLLTTTEDAEDAYHKMRGLVRSNEYRERLVHRAQRHLWEHGTYRHRARQVVEAIGFKDVEQSASHSFVVTTNRPHYLATIFENVARQNVEQKQLILLTHGFETEGYELDRLKEESGLHDVRLLHAHESVSLGSNLNRLFSESEGQYTLRMDDDDYYGANYSRDLVHALEYSGSELVGKAESYIYFEDRDATVLTYQGHSHRQTDFVRGATFCGRADTLRSVRFPELRTSEDSGYLSSLVAAGGSVYAADRFNFLVMRRTDKNSHTWRVSDAGLFGSGELKFMGCDPKQVDA